MTVPDRLASTWRNTSTGPSVLVASSSIELTAVANGGSGARSNPPRGVRIASRNAMEEICPSPTARNEDRKRVVEGKSVSVRVDLGGRRIIQKKKTNN